MRHTTSSSGLCVCTKKNRPCLLYPSDQLNQKCQRHSSTHGDWHGWRCAEGSPSLPSHQFLTRALLQICSISRPLSPAVPSLLPGWSSKLISYKKRSLVNNDYASCLYCVFYLLGDLSHRLSHSGFSDTLPPPI